MTISSVIRPAGVVALIACLASPALAEPEFTVKVVAAPKDATVSVDGGKAKQAPHSFTLEEGEHEFTATWEDCGSRSRTLIVKKNQTVNLKLKRKVMWRGPAGAKVMDAKGRPLGSVGGSKSLPEGGRTVKVQLRDTNEIHRVRVRIKHVCFEPTEVDVTPKKNAAVPQQKTDD